MKDNRPIIVYDGVCNLCNSSCNFILKRDKQKQFRLVALQSDEAKELIENYAITENTDSVILIHKNTYFIESDAVIEISRLLPFPWNWGVAFRIIPKNWRDSVYRQIAKHRYRWFGKQQTVCHIKE